MDSEKRNPKEVLRSEGTMYALIGVIFFAITLDIAFPIVMFLMKVLFWVLGALLIIGGFIQIKDSLKKRNTDEI